MYMCFLTGMHDPSPQNQKIPLLCMYFFTGMHVHSPPTHTNASIAYMFSFSENVQKKNELIYNYRIWTNIHLPFTKKNETFHNSCIFFQGCAFPQTLKFRLSRLKWTNKNYYNAPSITPILPPCTFLKKSIDYTS